MSIKVAIAGAPNTGKTTLFNHLAGVSHKVGNWPGQTVDRHTGEFRVGTQDFELVDLPGTYGLVAVSMEEAIATRYLLDESPDVVVTVCDGRHSSNTGIKVPARSWD